MLATQNPTAQYPKILKPNTLTAIGFFARHHPTIAQSCPDSPRQYSGHLDLKCVDLTQWLCPSNVVTHSPVATLHTRTVLSHLERLLVRHAISSYWLNKSVRIVVLVVKSYCCVIWWVF